MPVVIVWVISYLKKTIHEVEVQMFLLNREELLYIDRALD
jgi:hypothetical protein